MTFIIFLSNKALFILKGTIEQCLQFYKKYLHVYSVLMCFALSHD